MFSQASVILFTRGERYPSVHLGRPPGQTPRWADIPRADTPLGRHPPADTPPAQCMLGYTPPCPGHAGIHTPSCPVHAGIHAPLLAATAADGTHPTGMHSCV